MSELSVNDLVVRPGEGEQTASDMVIMFRTARLSGHFSIMEGVVRPYELLAPHSHENEDQHMYIIDGELEFEIGGRGGLRFSAGAGSHVLKPRGSSHCFWNVKETTVRYIETSTQDGFERFVDSRSGGIYSMVSNAESELGIRMYTERIPELMKEHGLKGLAGANMPTLTELLKDPSLLKILKKPEYREVLKEMAGEKLSELLPGI